MGIFSAIRRAAAGDPRGDLGRSVRWQSDSPYDVHFSHYE